MNTPSANTPKVITQPSELINFIESISTSPWLALDTEFMRESTYYPELCLIQIATENVSACIDVLSLEHIDPLLSLLKKPDQIKIFHSCRQDLEVLFATYNLIPQPLFDTQVSASILGLDEQISYAELVSQICNVQLDKSESRTDWKKRPLTQAQIDYALDDVNHLGALYLELIETLRTKDRLYWLEEECEQLIQPSNYSIFPEEAWTFVKGFGKLNAKQFYYLRKIAHWRETRAQSKNLPRRWLLADPIILELCMLDEVSHDAVSALLSELAPKSKRHSASLAEILQQPIPENEINQLQVPEDNRLSKEQRQLIKQLMDITRNKASTINTSASLLANRKSLVNLVLGKRSKVSSGWRKNEIADELDEALQSASN